MLCLSYNYMRYMYRQYWHSTARTFNPACVTILQEVTVLDQMAGSEVKK